MYIDVIFIKNMIYLSNANLLSMLLVDRFTLLLCSFSGLDNFRFFKESEDSVVLSMFDCLVSSLYRVKPILSNSPSIISGNSSCNFFLFFVYHLIKDPSLDSVFDFDLVTFNGGLCGFSSFSGRLFRPAKPIII